jgi:curved DNA-binding protein CbpA
VKELANQSHYEVLELSPDCAADEVEPAYRRAQSQLGPNALATYALAAPSETQALQQRLDEAFAVLNDPEARKVYDERLAEASGGERAPKAETATNGATAPATAAAAELSGEPPKEAASPSEAGDTARPVHKTEADLAPDAPVTGDALRRVREARGLSLKDLAAKTKIGHWHLDNIEREKYSALPALVYLRGFLGSLARELKLDPVRVARSYLEQMAKAHPPPGES